MKYTNIIFTALAAVMFLACQPAEENIFGVEVGTEDGKLNVGPEGGIYTIDIKSSDSWVVESSVPWIMVSPANANT